MSKYIYFSFLSLTLLLGMNNALIAQAANVGIGTTNPDGSARLHVESTNQGVLLPRLNDSQEGSIAGPATGLLYYNTNRNRFKVYDGGIYQTMLAQEPSGRISMLQAGNPISYLDYGANPSVSVSGPDGTSGWKLRLYGSGALDDAKNYGLGIDNNTLWYATDDGSGSVHRWFHGNTRTMELNENGRLHALGGYFAPGGAPGASGSSFNGYAFLHANGTGSDEGIYSLADNQVNIFTNAAERVRIDDTEMSVFGGVNARRFYARGGAPGGNNANQNGYAFSGSGDNDSGVFSEGNGQVSLFTNAIERVEVTDGNTNIKNTLNVESNFRSSGVVPIQLVRYTNLGDNISHPTGFPISEWNAAIVGFEAANGDIQENGVGKIIQMRMVNIGGNWTIWADFRSHNTNENWDVDVMFIHKNLSSRSNYNF